MSSKSIYGLEISGMQRMLESMSPVLNSVQMSNAVAAAMSTSIINQQLFNATQPIREATERWNQMFNTVEMNGLRESLMRTSNLMGTSSVIEATNNLQRALKSASLQMNLSSSVQQLNFNIDPMVIKQIQGISIDVTAIDDAIKNNLKIFKELDWSSIISSEDLKELDMENALNGPVISINDGISFQQRIVDFVDHIKTKYPIMFYIFVFLVLPPIQDGVIDGVTQLIKGVTTPIIEQAQTTDYKVIEKNIRIEVNNTLNINIESKDVRDEFMKIYGYVSTEKLVMRQTNKVKSRALHTLEFGQVVRIINKDRSWTLVEYENGEDAIQGWVFTRYISKFKK